MQTCTFLGGDNRVGVILGTYQPVIECRGFLPGWDQCPQILWGMMASPEYKRFGPVTDSKRQVNLPILYTSGKKSVPEYTVRSSAQYDIAEENGCAMRVFSVGLSDWTSWYKLWEAGTALYYRCARLEKGGIFTGLGQPEESTLGVLKASLISCRRYAEFVSCREHS